MASYFFEGFLERLMDPTDSASAKLLRDATIYCVPVRMPYSHFCVLVIFRIRPNDHKRMNQDSWSLDGLVCCALNGADARVSRI